MAPVRLLPAALHMHHGHMYVGEQHQKIARITISPFRLTISLGPSHRRANDHASSRCFGTSVPTATATLTSPRSATCPETTPHSTQQTQSKAALCATRTRHKTTAPPPIPTSSTPAGLVLSPPLLLPCPPPLPVRDPQVPPPRRDPRGAPPRRERRSGQRPNPLSTPTTRARARRRRKSGRCSGRRARGLAAC